MTIDDVVYVIDCAKVKEVINTMYRGSQTLVWCAKLCGKKRLWNVVVSVEPWAI